MYSVHCTKSIGIALRQSSDIITENSFATGNAGTDARRRCNSVIRGGVNDGNVHDPIRNGAVVDINNSPEIVNPKLS